MNINVEHDDDHFVISDDVTLNYGVGCDFMSALVDYCETVLEWHAMTTKTMIGKEFDNAYDEAMQIMDEETPDFVLENEASKLSDDVLKKATRIMNMVDWCNDNIPCFVLSDPVPYHEDKPTILEEGNHLKRRGRYARS